MTTFAEDPGKCPDCSAPWEMVRPGKSQPVCDCQEGDDERDDSPYCDCGSIPGEEEDAENRCSCCGKRLEP